MNVLIQSPFDNLPCEGFRKQRYWLMAEAFVAAGHRVSYFTTDFNHGTKRRRAASSGMVDGIDVHLVPTPPYSKNVSLLRVFSHAAYARRFERAASRVASPDIVISATPTLGAAMAAMRIARRAGAKFAIDIQDAWPETFYRLLPRGLTWLGKVLLAPMHRAAKRLYREADMVTGVSERYRMLSGRTDFSVSYHGIEVAGNAASSERRRPGAIVYAGNLGEGYDLETVIAAVGRDSSLTLDIAGSGPREAMLRKAASNLVAEGRVSFHGYLSREKLDELLRSSSIGVIPMRDDSWVGLPYKLCDYLVAGLPVASSLHGECGALLEREKLGFTYEYGSPASLLDAVRRINESGIAGTAKLPSSLDASRIYADYVNRIVS